MTISVAIVALHCCPALGPKLDILAWKSYGVELAHCVSLIAI